MNDLQDSAAREDIAARREGIVAGLLGAAVVALFYFIVDIIRGHPLMTPSVLGEVFIIRNPSPNINTPNLVAVFLYTGFHILAFSAFGLFLAALTSVSERSNLARYALVQLLVVFEVLFYGVLSLASEVARGLFPFWGVLAANTLAAAVMMTYMWRHHPAVKAALRGAPLGAQEAGARAPL